MKQKITNHDQGAELVEKEKPCDQTASDSAEEIETLNMYWMAYSYPFMPSPYLYNTDKTIMS